MVEAREDSKSEDYTPSDQEQILILKHLGEHAIVDKKYKATVVLSREQAAKRRALIREVEYDF